MVGRKIFIGLIILAVLAGMVLWYFYGQALNGRLTASGTIEAIEVEVASEVTGRIIKLNVVEGDNVEAGQIIAAIDDQELQELFKQAGSNLSAATTQVNQAKANLAFAKDNWERNQPLYEQRIISNTYWINIETNYRNAQQAYAGAQAGEQQARAAVDLARTRLDRAVVRAPIGGTILLKAVEAGELATPGRPLVTMADLSKVKLVVYVPEIYLGRLRLQDDAAVTTDSYPGKKYIGKVVYIADKAEFTPKNIQTQDERVTQVYGVKLEIPNPDHELKPGMPADALLTEH